MSAPTARPIPPPPAAPLRSFAPGDLSPREARWGARLDAAAIVTARHRALVAVCATQRATARLMREKPRQAAS